MKTHRVQTGSYQRYGHTRWWWECSCGRSGSVDEFGQDVALASDAHIDYAAGDRRRDVQEKD